MLCTSAEVRPRMRVTGKPWRRLAGQGGFDGSEGPDLVPGWVVECMDRGGLPRREIDLKLPFHLFPAEVGSRV